MPGNVPAECPCESVRSIDKRLTTLEQKVNSDSVTLVSMLKDIEYIKEKVSGKDKFNTGVAMIIIQSVIAIIFGYIAIKLGLT